MVLETRDGDGDDDDDDDAMGLWETSGSGCIYVHLNWYIYIHTYNIVYHIASNMSAQNMICMMCMWSAYNVHVCIYCIVLYHIISYYIIIYYISICIIMYYDTVHLDHIQRPKIYLALKQCGLAIESPVHFLMIQPLISRELRLSLYQSIYSKKS